MSKTFTRTVEYDFDGNAFIEIPEEICEELGLVSGDVMVWEISDNQIILRKLKETFETEDEWEFS